MEALGDGGAGGDHSLGLCVQHGSVDDLALLARNSGQVRLRFRRSPSPRHQGLATGRCRSVDAIRPSCRSSALGTARVAP
jgi:hypothetical protein